MMNEVWLLHPQAVYHHEPIGIYPSEQDAQAAKAICEQISDGHHDLEITRYVIGKPNIYAVKRLFVKRKDIDAEVAELEALGPM